MTTYDTRLPAGEPTVEAKLELCEWIVRHRWDLAINLAMILHARGVDIDDPVSRTAGLREAAMTLTLEIANVMGNPQ